MSFFPKEETVLRRGVAMKLINPLDVTPAHRDKWINEQARKFEGSEYVLNHALDRSPAEQSKVRTFHGDSDAPAATKSTGELLSPALAPKPARLLRHPPVVRVSDADMPLYYNRKAEEHRNADAKSMADAHGFDDNFSPQRRNLHHKVMAPHDVFKAGQQNLLGFKGLGAKSTYDRPVGKGRPGDGAYDPLGIFKKHPGSQPVGVKLCEMSGKGTMSSAMAWDASMGPNAGVPGGGAALPNSRHPRLRTMRHLEPSTWGSNAPIGFQARAGPGMESGPPVRFTASRRVLTPIDHHNIALDPVFGGGRSSAPPDQCFTEGPTPSRYVVARR
jgi:hypothetical protein